MNTLVSGSLKSVADRLGLPLAAMFLDVDAIVMIDTSGSMSYGDCYNGQTRYNVARDQLIKLQNDIPGKIAVISWSDRTLFCPNGIPEFLNGGTDLAGLLKFVKPGDGTGIQLILISDGEPDNETKALELAGDFKSKISTIYCGPELGPGRDFLRRLAELTGGQAVSQSVKDIPNLKQTVTKLLN